MNILGWMVSFALVPHEAIPKFPLKVNITVPIKKLKLEDSYEEDVLYESKGHFFPNIFPIRSY